MEELVPFIDEVMLAEMLGNTRLGAVMVGKPVGPVGSRDVRLALKDGICTDGMVGRGRVELMLGSVTPVEAAREVARTVPGIELELPLMVGMTLGASRDPVPRVKGGTGIEMLAVTDGRMPVDTPVGTMVEEPMDGRLELVVFLGQAFELISRALITRSSDSGSSELLLVLKKQLLPSLEGI